MSEHTWRVPLADVRVGEDLVEHEVATRAPPRCSAASVGPDDLNLDLADVEEALSQRTKAILVLDYGGHPPRGV